MFNKLGVAVFDQPASMYNGVGILTPRGTGTSGHIQNNKFNLRGGPPPKFGDAKPPEQERKPNKEILEHNRKRQIELKLVELRETLEEEGYVGLGQQHAILVGLHAVCRSRNARRVAHSALHCDLQGGR